MTYEADGSGFVSRRKAVRAFAGAATVVAGSAVLAACGAAGSTATNTGTTKSSAASTGASSGAITVTPGTASKVWYTVTPTQLAITDRGNDCWGSADTCTYLDQKASGAGTWTVQVVNLDNTNSWAKAGIMARSVLANNSADVFLAVTISNGVVLQYREATGDNEGGTNSDNQSLESNASGGVAPMWLKLQTDASFNWTGWNSTDGKTWANATVGAENPVSLGSSYLVGLAATAHNNAAHGVATFASPGGFKSKTFTADLVGTNDTLPPPTAPPVPGA
jgi:hypothetical protein